MDWKNEERGSGRGGWKKSEGGWKWGGACEGSRVWGGWERGWGELSGEVVCKTGGIEQAVRGDEKGGGSEQERWWGELEREGGG